jgi:endonuclease/exonuclease/phosphatase family metal-dependent hydrolase
VANGLTATSCGVVPDKQPNGACASDHKPILAELAFA